MKTLAKVLLLTPVLLGLLPQTASACAVCMGGGSDHINAAITASMGLLLGFVFAIGAAILCFIRFLAKCDGLPLDEPSLSAQPVKRAPLTTF